MFTIQDDLTRYEDMKITLRTMITMRIIAVKLPMMIPMTRDMVGDIPGKDTTLQNSTDITTFCCEFYVCFLAANDGVSCFVF